jgi:hypothetical protein
MSATTQKTGASDMPSAGGEACKECNLKHDCVAMPLSFAVRLMTTQQQQQKSDEGIYFIDRFSFKNEGSVESLMNHLQTKGFNTQKDSYLDQYFDTEDGKLSKNQMFLRKRDTDWILARVASEKVADTPCVELFKNLDDIKKILSSIGVKDEVDTTNIHLKAALSTKAVENKDKIPMLQRLCPCRIACIPANRLCFSADNDEKVVRLATVLLGDKYYTIGSLKTTKKTRDNLMATLKDYISPPRKGKLLISKSGLCVTDEASQLWHKSDFPGIPNPSIPFDQMSKVGDRAVKEEISLDSAYQNLGGQGQKPLKV